MLTILNYEKSLVPSSGSCCEARVDDLLRRVLIVGEVIHQKRRDLLGINIVWGYRQSAMRIEWDYKGFHIYIYISVSQNYYWD